MTKTVKAAHVWERPPEDWYVEPSRVTAQLLAVERFEGAVHDPCCGGGNIVQACLAAGLEATGSDIIVRVSPLPAWHLGVYDFRNNPIGTFGAQNCIFNPPYFRAKGTESFIRHALTLSPKVAAFTETRFLGGSGRAAGLFAEFPPDRVWLITPRPSCPPGDYLAAGGIAGNGTSDWCWLVWDERRGETNLGWIR